MIKKWNSFLGRSYDRVLDRFLTFFSVPPNVSNFSFAASRLEDDLYPSEQFDIFGDKSKQIQVRPSADISPLSANTKWQLFNQNSSSVWIKCKNIYNFLSLISFVLKSLRWLVNELRSHNGMFYNSILENVQLCFDPERVLEKSPLRQIATEYQFLDGWGSIWIIRMVYWFGRRFVPNRFC